MGRTLLTPEKLETPSSDPDRPVSLAAVREALERLQGGIANIQHDYIPRNYGVCPIVEHTGAAEVNGRRCSALAATSSTSTFAGP